MENSTCGKQCFYDMYNTESGSWDTPNYPMTMRKMHH